MVNDPIIELRKLSQRYAYTSIQMHETISRKAGFSGTDHKYLGFFLQKGNLTAGELALGEGKERIYIVEPTGLIEDDPNLTDKRFSGKPTKSYRSLYPFKVIGEITEGQGHSPEQLNHMKEHLERLKQQGIEAIED